LEATIFPILQANNQSATMAEHNEMFAIESLNEAMMEQSY
jgi:hypothetical protein